MMSSMTTVSTKCRIGWISYASIRDGRSAWLVLSNLDTRPAFISSISTSSMMQPYIPQRRASLCVDCVSSVDRMLIAIAIAMPLYVMASSHHMLVGVLLRSAISLISLNDTVGVKELYTAMTATTTIRNCVTNPCADRILLK